MCFAVAYRVPWARLRFPTDVCADDLFERALELNREASDFAVRPLEARVRELLPGCTDATDAELDRVCRGFVAPIFACARPDPETAYGGEHLLTLALWPRKQSSSATIRAGTSKGRDVPEFVRSYSRRKGCRCC